jgi:tetratricopeptide (TPR) repeat protein
MSEGQARPDLEQAYHAALARLVALTNPTILADAAATVEIPPGLDRAGADLLVRREAGLQDLLAPLPPRSAKHRPARLILVAAVDPHPRHVAAGAIARACGAALVAPMQALTAALIERGDVGLDHWLGAQWYACERPATMVVEADAATLAALAGHAGRPDGALTAGALRRAAILRLRWSDLALGVAQAWFDRLDGLPTDGFDRGFARTLVGPYIAAARQEARIDEDVRMLAPFRTTEAQLLMDAPEVGALEAFAVQARLELQTPLDLATVCRPPSARARDGAALIRRAAEAAAAGWGDISGGQGARMRLAKALQDVGRHKDAGEAFLDACREDPASVPARLAAAHYLELAGRTAEAERLLREGLKRDRAGGALLQALAGLCQRQGQARRFLAALRLAGRRGVDVSFDFGAVARGEAGLNADVLVRVLRPSRREAWPTQLRQLADLEAQAARPADRSPQALFFQADALRRLGRFGEALELYRSALGEDPALPERLSGVPAALHPRFLLIGPARTGTSLLRQLLNLHPGVGTASGEPSVFSAPGAQRTPSSFADYLARFQTIAEQKPGAVLFGEKSPSYARQDADAVAIADLLLPHSKIIAGLREPVARAWSHMKLHGRALDGALFAELGGTVIPAWMRLLLDDGRYLQRIEPWARVFGRERLLLVSAEALDRDIEAEADRIFRWLGLDALADGDAARLQRDWNNRTARVDPDPRLAEFLTDHYAGEPWSPEEIEKRLAEGEGA